MEQSSVHLVSDCFNIKFIFLKYKYKGSKTPLGGIKPLFWHSKGV